MNSKDIEALRNILKAHGLSSTDARIAVCQALWGKEPQAMSQLVSATASSMNRASLYRTIDLFEKIGLVHRIYMGWKYKIELSDLLTHHHHHLSCTNCGSITAMHEEAEIEKLIQQIARRYGMQAQRHQLEIQGVCKVCQQKTL